MPSGRLPRWIMRLLQSLEVNNSKIERLERCAEVTDDIINVVSGRVSLLEEEHEQNMRKLEATEMGLKAVEVLNEEKEERLQRVEEELRTLKQHLQEQRGQPPTKRLRGSVASD